VRAFAAAWDGPLHLLVDNAGVMAIQALERNADGWETVRHQPPRALRARPRAARRPRGRRQRAHRLGELERAPARR
jgi:hypothetical protein